MRTRWLLSIVIVILALITGAPPAHAVCTNPDGAAGSIVFNADFRTMQYCDDTNWRRIGASSNAPMGCPNVGDVCTDGTIYAGESPDGNFPMFTTPDDAGQFFWNNGNGTGEVAVTGTDNIAGKANTEAIAATDADSSAAGFQSHQAANHCSNLSAHGHSDWYLPARFELDELYANRVSIGGFDASGANWEGYYWSSSEANTSSARGKRFSDGVDWGGSKNNPLSVRCVRKEGTKLTSIVPDGLVAHWKLDETSGTTAIDQTGNNDLTYGNISLPTDSVDGRLGTAIDFGTDANADATANNDITPIAATRDLTVSAWVKFEGDPETGNLGIVDLPGYFLFRKGFGSASMQFIPTAWDTAPARWGPDIPVDTWTHLAVTYSYNDPVGTEPVMYRNGVPFSPGSGGWGSGPYNAPTNNNIVLGKRHDSSASAFQGVIDDVRIYDRVLSPEEIHYLYQSFDANVKYDADRRVPKYFNGEEWVAMGESKYVPNAVEFSEAESDNLQLTGAISGLTGTKQFTYSMWFRRVIDRSISGCQTVLDMDEFGVGNRGVQLITAGDGRLAWRAHDSAGQELLNIGTLAENFEDNRWYHIVGSFDISNPKPATRHVYVNDVLDQGNDLATISGPDIDFSTALMM